MCSHREISLLTKMGIMFWLTVPSYSWFQELLGAAGEHIVNFLSPILSPRSFAINNPTSTPLVLFLVFSMLVLSFSIVRDIWCYFFWPEDFICDRCRNQQEAQAQEAQAQEAQLQE